MARNQLRATSAAIDWRAYSKSACADAASAAAAARPYLTRPQRSSSQLRVSAPP